MQRALFRLLLTFQLILSVLTTSYAQDPPNDFTGSSAGTVITLSWTPENGPPTNEGYIIKARRTPGGAFPATPAHGDLPISNDNDLTDGAAIIQIADEDIATYNGFINIVAGAQYDFEIFTYDNNSLSSAAATTVYTLATDPGTFPGSFTFTATAAATQIDLAFTKASLSPMNAHGYLLLRRAGNNPTLVGISDGSAPGGTYLLATITDSTATSYVDNTALGGITYHYALVPYRVGFNGAIPIDETYNYGSLSTISTATIPLTTTIDEITGGIAASPLGSSSTEQAILGFSIVSNGTPNFTAINIQVTSSALNKFSNAYLYQSTNNTFGPADTPVGSVTDNLTGTEIQLSGFSVALSSSPQYFFIVVDVQDTVSSSSPTLTPSFTNANISISGGGTVTVNGSPITGTTYSFIDAAPPQVSSLTPANNATNVSVLLNSFTIVFNEPIVFTGNSSTDLSRRIVLYDDDSNVNRDTIEVADINVVGNTVTFTTTFSLQDDENYDIIIGNNVFEDAAGNNFAGLAEDDWDFDTELSPNISSLSGTTRCINDVLTISGQRFTGTGGSGNTQPIVRINGFQVPPGNITAYSSTSITLTVPSGASTGNVVVENADNGLTSNGSALTVHPAMITNLDVNPETLSPAQNTSVDIDILGTQSNYNYWLIANSTPAGYTATTQNTAGGGNITLTTTPALDEIGDYTYRVEVRRMGCTTRTLDQTPFTLTVASLAVSVSATNTTVCEGTSTILIGSTSGGTGFYQFSWVGPNGFSSNSSSPEHEPEHPAGTGYYILTLTDNSANIAKDSVYITTSPTPAVSFIPVGDATSVQTEYTNQDQRFELNGSPNQLISGGATFSGAGVFPLPDSNKYYFNPSIAGNGIHSITYSYTNGTCSNDTTINFRVSSTFIDNLEPFYCENTLVSDVLELSGTGATYLSTYYPSYTYTRLRFLKYEYNSLLGFYTFSYFDSPPLNPTGQPGRYRLNIQQLISAHGIDPPNTYYYVVVFAADANKLANPVSYPGYVDEAVLYNYFRIVRLGLPPNIIGIKESENICSDGGEISLSQSIDDYSINSFSITNPFGASISGNEFDPNHSSLVNDGRFEIPLTLTLNYDDFNGCANTTATNFNWVKKPLGPSAQDVEYCQLVTGSGGTFTIDASRTSPATNPYWYEQNPDVNPSAVVLDSVNFRGFVAPGINGLTPTTKEFYVTQNYKGCEGEVTIVSITINAAPNASITTSQDQPICEDRTFTLFAPEESPGTPYPTYIWSFGDGRIDTVFNENTITHNYGPGTGGSLKTITLQVYNSDQCLNIDELANQQVGLNPTTNFTYNFVCNGDTTEFVGEGTNPTAAYYSWDFGDGLVLPRDTLDFPVDEGGIMKEPFHKFGGPGVYDVTVTAFSPAGCFNSKTRSIQVLRYLTHSTELPYQINSDSAQWTIDDVAGNTSWSFATPTTNLMSGFTSPAWVTNPDGAYNANEISYLNSPCLDIYDVLRPVISFDFVLNSSPNSDGIVLEYSTNGGENWSSVGGLNSGINWFNTPGFFSGTIGSSAIGWSGNSWNLTDNPENDTLTQARRALDNISTREQRRKLRFRFAFKSDATTDLSEGFAFNNLKIETRNRIILIENFTNENDPAYTANNAKFTNNFDNTIASDEAVKLQYHVGFPQPDDHYSINTSDPSARAAFYGIPLTDQYVPLGFIDGKTSGNFTNTTWVENEYDKRSLKVSPYELTVSSLPSTDPTYLKFNVDVTALTRIFAFQRPVLHIALVEKNPDADNDFVLRKMIPDAAGIRLPSPMNQGESENIVDSVRLDNPAINLDSIAIIAFIQDALPPREVYQAAIDLNPTNLPDKNLITGIEDPAFAEKILIYPNPANREVNVVLPERTLTPIALNLIDAHGRTVHTNGFATGEQQKTIDTNELASGLYILQFNTQQGVVRKKVMVVHER